MIKSKVRNIFTECLLKLMIHGRYLAEESQLSTDEVLSCLRLQRCSVQQSDGFFNWDIACKDKRLIG